MWWLVLGVAIGVAAGEVVTLLFRRKKEEPPFDAAMTLKLSHAETEAANWKQKCFDLQAEAARSKETSGLLEAENEKLRRDVAQHSESMLEMRSRLHETDTVGSAAAAQAGWDEAKNEAERARTDLERVTAHLDDARHQLMLSQDEGARLQNEIDALNHSLADSRRTVEDLHAYRSEVEALRSAEAARAGLEEELSAAQRRIDDLQSRIEDGEAASHRLEAVQSEAETARATLAEKEAALSGLRTELDEAKALAQQADAANERTVGLEQELSELRERLEASEAAAEQHRQEADGLKRQIESDREQVLQAQNLKTKAETLEKDVESLKLVSASKDQAVAESIENLRRIEAQLAYRPSAEEVARLQAELDARRSTIAELQEQIERTRSDEDETREDAPVLMLAEASDTADDPPLVYDGPETVEPEPVEEVAAVDSPDLYETGQGPAEDVPEPQVDEAASETEVEVPPAQEAPVWVSEEASRTGAPVFQPIRPAGKDPLIQIIGIGHLYERKLRDAGVLTYSDLAAMSPDRILEIIQPAEWQRIEPERWIEDAARLATGAAS